MIGAQESTPGKAAVERPESTWTWVLLVGLWVLGAWLRMRHVGDAFLFGDEFHSLRDMQGGYLQTLSHFSETGAGLALPFLQKGLIDLFGAGHWSLRAPAWLPGLLLLLFVYPLVRRRFGETVGLLTTAWVAIEPLLVFYSHFGRIYSLVALLSLFLLMQIEWLLDRDRVSARRLFTLGACTALLPWAHPTALGFVLPVYLAAIVSAARTRDQTPSQRRRRVSQLIAALALGGTLCLLAYLPAFASMWDFVRTKTDVRYYGDFGLLDMMTLVGGNRSAAWALLLTGGAAAGFWLQEKRWRGGPLVMAVVGPFLVIAWTQPYGDAYAYARYVLPAVAPLGLLLAVGLREALRSWNERGRLVTQVVFLIGVATLFFSGPLAPGVRPTAPQHANTYLSLLALPAFDEPWPETPDFYRELVPLQARAGRPLRILELPALHNRARHLYRHYQLQHGADTVLAALPGEFPRIPDGPYVSPSQNDWIARAEADYLIVHLDVGQETADYWGWVYGPEGPGPFAVGEAAPMERHARYGQPLPRVSPRLRETLSAAFGTPVYRDRHVEVFALQSDDPD